MIDTAGLSQIQEANDLGILNGVTTNPSLMAKEGIQGHEAILKHYQDICAIAVSYTHLDVYKRQGLYITSRKGNT